LTSSAESVLADSLTSTRGALARLQDEELREPVEIPSADKVGVFVGTEEWCADEHQLDGEE